jgi:serine/threonine protein kinase
MDQYDKIRVCFHRLPIIPNLFILLFTQTQLLGKGTYGKAWLARDKTTQQLYVVKDIKVQNQQELDEALAEADVLSKIQHINITRYIGSYAQVSVMNNAMKGFCLSLPRIVWISQLAIVNDLIDLLASGSFC